MFRLRVPRLPPGPLRSEVERQTFVDSVKLGLLWFLLTCFFLCLISIWFAKPVTWAMLWRAALFIPILPAITAIAFWLDHRADRRTLR
jgi:hypothetical protein